jgi:hypothetical protein
MNSGTEWFLSGRITYCLKANECLVVSADGLSQHQSLLSRTEVDHEDYTQVSLLSAVSMD